MNFYFPNFVLGNYPHTLSSHFPDQLVGYDEYTHALSPECTTARFSAGWRVCWRHERAWNTARSSATDRLTGCESVVDVCSNLLSRRLLPIRPSLPDARLSDCLAIFGDCFDDRWPPPDCPLPFTGVRFWAGVGRCLATAADLASRCLAIGVEALGLDEVTPRSAGTRSCTGGGRTTACLESFRGRDRSVLDTSYDRRSSNSDKDRLESTVGRSDVAAARSTAVSVPAATMYCRGRSFSPPFNLTVGWSSVDGDGRRRLTGPLTVASAVVVSETTNLDVAARTPTGR